jgi:hypothetical protein
MTTNELLSAYRSADGEISCFRITPKLRQGDTLSHEQEAMVKQLEELLRSSPPLKQELVVYRGCAVEELETSGPYPSFMSTSTDLMEAMRFCRGCIAKIVVPQGMRIVKVSPDATHAFTLERHEYLLPRNLTFESGKWNLSEEESMKIMLSSSINPVTVRLFLVSAPAGS